MDTVHIAIIGGGLSGLFAAYQLTQQGIHDYVVIEAKEAIGGRILSLNIDDETKAGTHTFDLGPTWYWPDYQPQLRQVIDTLDLPTFEQHETGDMLIEQASGQPNRMRGYPNVPASVRLYGGMGALIDALADRLPPANIRTGLTVKRLNSGEDRVEINVADTSGASTTLRAERVLLAIPPRIAVSRIVFDPPLPESLVTAWRHTNTWMAPHAKHVAVYDTPFWREQQLSGEARSGRGPMAEIHDASVPDGIGALFGFIGVPPNVRASLPEGALLEKCRMQLIRLFGDKAANPVAHVIKDWAADSFVATPEDLVGYGMHSSAPASTASSAPWHGRVIGIASEWSPQFPGYVAGAVEAASIGVRELLVQDKRSMRTQSLLH
ncbi:amine oxidase [Pandoraea terrae]|uniref:Amine oxidase n=1 Tax=Pandoraea terrae TaxID=1537710 RepID=A0A5E4VDM0_9BURK|nr:FAD-dependent oxidoreductase [Pandoraea terrae]VVE09873.1 amine oxidase [Pandoraea terrae]